MQLAGILFREGVKVPIGAWQVGQPKIVRPLEECVVLQKGILECIPGEGGTDRPFCLVSKAGHKVPGDIMLL